MGILSWVFFRPSLYEKPHARRRKVAVQSSSPKEGDTDTASDIESDSERFIVADDTFRGSRVHFFRQVPSFLLNLEGFLAYAGMCLAHITLESVMAPVRMVGRGFRLRDTLATIYVLSGVLSLYLATPYDSRLYSSIYHIIRASSTIKLYVIFNILELADKLLSAFNTDIIEATWALIRSRGASGGTKGAPANAEPKGSVLEIIFMTIVGCGMVMLHTIVLLCHVATINVSVNSEGSSLTGLLISNNFVEVKSVVFKKHTPEALQSVVFLDAVEGVQHAIFIIAMLLQHVLTSEGPGSLEMGQIALILVCEVGIDFLKHVCVARFNCIKLEVYKNFLHTCFLDVSLRRFLAAARLPVVQSFTSGKTDLVSATTTFDLSHAHFIPNPAHRCAFVPFPYAGLLLWAAWPAAKAILLSNPFVAIVCLLLLVSLNAFLKTFTLSWAAAYTITVVRKDTHNKGLGVSEAPVPDAMTPSTADRKSLYQRADSSATFGVTHQAPHAVHSDRSPSLLDLGEGKLPSPNNNVSQSAATPTVCSSPSVSATTPMSSKPRVYVVLDALTQSLLEVDKYDLQAGKKKK